jgi:hypothetical protein
MIHPLIFWPLLISIPCLAFLAGVRVENWRWLRRVRDLHNMVEGARAAKEAERAKRRVCKCSE